jgi:hypothetical protein
MDCDPKVLIGFIGVVGLLLGAVAQDILARKTAKNKKYLEVKTEAYLNFVRSISERASHAHPGTPAS